VMVRTLMKRIICMTSNINVITEPLPIGLHRAEDGATHPCWIRHARHVRQPQAASGSSAPYRRSPAARGRRHRPSQPKSSSFRIPRITRK
jgi:hypothetical protein